MRISKPTTSSLSVPQCSGNQLSRDIALLFARVYNYQLICVQGEPSGHSTSSVWADGNLAESSGQLAKMVEL